MHKTNQTELNPRKTQKIAFECTLKIVFHSYGIKPSKNKLLPTGH